MTLRWYRPGLPDSRAPARRRPPYRSDWEGTCRSAPAVAVATAADPRVPIGEPSRRVVAIQPVVALVEAIGFDAVAIARRDMRHRLSEYPGRVGHGRPDADPFQGHQLVAAVRLRLVHQGFGLQGVDRRVTHELELDVVLAHRAHARL